MKKIQVADITIKSSGGNGAYSLSFREKIEVAKLLEKLNVDVIELHTIENPAADILLVKSICSAIQNSIIAVPVGVTIDGIELAAKGLEQAKKARLQVELPVSNTQMEYIMKKKPEAMLALIRELITESKKHCEDVEFVALDATRSSFDFLIQAISVAASAGAKTITICDTAGVMLADEFYKFMRNVLDTASLPDEVTVGAACSNALSMADASTIAAISAGASVLKTGACESVCASLKSIVDVLGAKHGQLGAMCEVKTTMLQRIIKQIDLMCKTERSSRSPFDNGVQAEDDTFLTCHDSEDAVYNAIKGLGYELSAEDERAVFAEFSKIAQKKERISLKELDAIVASAAMQVPSIYQLESYVINTGNHISATAHMRIYKKGTLLEGISLGDGPIDAAFLAIEQIAGNHFELDDFQIKAITEGREATGESVVKLRSGGRIYSGRGISTDIVGASINAYINALNKIVYEQGEG